MKYRFLSVHKIIGVTRPADAKEVIIASYPEINASASIVYQLDDKLHELDRASAVAMMMLKGLVGRAGEQPPHAQLEKEVGEIREKREKETASDVYLLFEAEGDVDSWNPRVTRSFDNFTVAIEAAPKTPIKTHYQQWISGALAAFALATEQVCGVKKITDGVYFVDEKGNSVYSIELGLSSNAIVSTGLRPEAIDYVKAHAKTLGEHPELVDPARLLSRSLDESSDRLLSFLSVWAALEIFANKVFKVLEPEMFSSMTEPSTSSHVIERIRGVMKDKYRVADKFAFIASVLCAEDEAQDLARFKSFKDLRDRVMHGADVPLDALPTNEVQVLLRKYLDLYTKTLKA